MSPLHQSPIVSSLDPTTRLADATCSSLPVRSTWQRSWKKGVPWLALASLFLRLWNKWKVLTPPSGAVRNHHCHVHLARTQPSSQSKPASLKFERMLRRAQANYVCEMARKSGKCVALIKSNILSFIGSIS